MLEKKIDNINQNQNLGTVTPIIHSDFHELSKAIKIQNEENEKLQKQITHIKKEK